MTREQNLNYIKKILAFQNLKSFKISGELLKKFFTFLLSNLERL